MATVNPPGLYTEGAAVVSSQPVVNIMQQFLVRKQARDEALDDYFRNINKSVNPAGVRNQDIEGLTKKQAEWQQFYQQKKDAIKNPKLDNGKSFTEYQSRYQDMQNYIQQSKNATAISEDLAKARLNPNLGYMFDDEAVIGKIGEHDKPLTDPTHKTLNIQELSIQPKPYDIKELSTIQKNAAYGLKPSEEVADIRIDPQTLDTITTTKKKYSSEDLQTVGNRYKQLYQMDRRLRSMADKSLMNAPNATELNDAYKNVYGKNAESPADLLAGQAILNMHSEGTFEKRTPGSLQQKRLLESIKQANRADLVKLRGQIKREDKALEGLWLDQFMADLDAETEKAQPWEISIKGKKSLEKPVAVDPVTAKSFTIGKAIPDRITKTADGKYRAIYYKYNDKGEPIKTASGKYTIDETLSDNTYTPQQYKLQLSKQTQSATQRAQEMQSGGAQQPAAPQKKYPLPAGKPRTVRQGKYTYEWSEEFGEYR